MLNKQAQIDALKTAKELVEAAIEKSERNMSYCRFENTYHDLYDCYESGEEIESESEWASFQGMIELCRNFVERYQDMENISYEDRPRLEEDIEEEDVETEGPELK